MSWIQAHVSLPRPFNPNPLWRALLDALDGWRPAHFFFLRKSPALRLRLYGTPAAELAAFLDERAARGDIGSWWFGAYEPSRHLFGGDEGMEVAHAHFDADARAGMGLDLHGGARDAASLACLNDLFRRCTEDPWEIWEVWRNLGEVRPVADCIPDDQQRALVWATVREDCPDADLRSANGATAERLQGLARQGRLGAGVRAILPFYAIFHWNMLRVDEAHQAALIAIAQQSLDPRAGMAAP